MAIRWAVPPAPNPGRPAVARPKYWAFAQALMKRPGEFAILTDDASSALAHQITKGLVRAFQPAGSFEAVSRVQPRSKPGRGRIYVRYVGEPDE